MTLMEGMKDSRPGVIGESYAELVFTGRIYIYHETYLLPNKINSLLEDYKKNGLSPQFRGRDYHIMKNSPIYKD